MDVLRPRPAGARRVKDGRRVAWALWPLVALAIPGCGGAATGAPAQRRAGIVWRRFEIGRSERCLPAAETDAAKARGLMGVRNPRPMVFVFTPPQRVGFWMKDTPAPPTGAWVGASGRVVGFWHGAPRSLAVHRSPGPVRFVIEYPSGAALPAVAARVRMGASTCPPGPRL